MATHQSGHRPGGGIASKQHVSIPVRTGSGSKSTRPAGTAQVGLMYGTHVTNRRESDYRGEKLHNPERNFQPTKFGNEVVAAAAKDRQELIGQKAREQAALKAADSK